MSKEFEAMSYRGKSAYFMKNQEWYYYKDDTDDCGFPLLTDKAPPLAVESYNFAKKKYEEHLKTGIIH